MPREAVDQDVVSFCGRCGGGFQKLSGNARDEDVRGDWTPGSEEVEKGFVEGVGREKVGVGWVGGGVEGC